MSAVLISKAKNGFIVQPYNGTAFLTDASTVSVFAEGQEAAIAAALTGLLAAPPAPNVREELTAAAAVLGATQPNPT